MASTAHFAFVGSFTTPERKARGIGIEVFRIAGDSWQRCGHAGGLTNPSFLLAVPEKNRLYTVHGDLDYATAFSINPETGALTSLGQAATEGRNGVHLALDPSGKFLIVANYGSGSLAALPLTADHALAGCIDILNLPGDPGPHRTEQTRAHPHHVVFDPSQRFLLVPDKGLDRIFVLTFDASLGELTLHGHVSMRPGAGPRHIVFHPTQPYAFVVNELDSTVATLHWDAETGTLTPLHLAAALPPEFFGVSTSAAIAITPDGRHIYASNRGHDSITHFEFADARLTARHWTPANGASPRFITLSPQGTHLLAATEHGDTITSFAIGPDGGLTPDGPALHIASPCTIAFF